MQSNDKYIQVGITALRTPTGEFLPPVPIYIKTSDIKTKNGLAASEESVLRDVAAIIATARGDREVR